MGRRRKPGKRAKSGRLSRAHLNPQVRDFGTLEAQAKRKALVGVNEKGDPNDPVLSATAVGTLYAHGYLTRSQYAEAIEYRRLRCAIYGAPWPTTGLGPAADEKALAEMEQQFEEKVRALTEYQKSVVANVAVFDWIPMWFFDQRNGWNRMLPEDYAEKEALVSGLDLMVGQGQRVQRRRDVSQLTALLKVL